MATGHIGVMDQFEAERETMPASSVGEEWQIEVGAVPGDDHPRRKVGQNAVGIGENCGFIAIENPVTGWADDRYRDHGSRRRVEAVDGGIGLDVQTVERWEVINDEMTVGRGSDSCLDSSSDQANHRHLGPPFTAENQ